MKHVMFAAALVYCTVSYGQSYAGFSFTSMQYENESLSEENLRWKNHSDNVLEVNLSFSQYWRGQEIDAVLTVQPGYREHSSYFVENNTANPFEEHIIDMPVTLHCYLNQIEDQIAFTIGVGAYPSYVVSRFMEMGGSADLNKFRMGLISDFSLRFNVTNDERIKAATGFRYKIDASAYKNNPGPSPAYRGGGVFLSISGRL